MTHSYLKTIQKLNIHPIQHISKNGNPRTSEGLHLLELDFFRTKSINNRVLTQEEKKELKKVKFNGFTDKKAKDKLISAFAKHAIEDNIKFNGTLKIT